MKDKSININIRNTNILKKDKKKRKRRSRDGKNKNKLPIGQPSQGASQPYVTSYPSFVAPQLPYNHDAMKHAEDYIAPRTNKNQLLLTNGEPETKTNKTKLLLKNSEPTEPTIQSSTTKSITKSRPIQTPIKKSVIMPKSRPTQYTQEGLMKVKTLKELRELMKVAIPGIDNKLLNKITNKNKSEAIKTFLNQYDKPSEPTPEPPKTPRKESETKPPSSFTTQTPTTTTQKVIMTPFESTPTPKFTTQTPMTIDTDDGSMFKIKTLQKLRDLKQPPGRSNLFNKTYDSSTFIRPKIVETPITKSSKKGRKIKFETPKPTEKPFGDDEGHNALYNELVKDHPDTATKNVIKKLIGNSITSPYTLSPNSSAKVGWGDD